MLAKDFHDQVAMITKEIGCDGKGSIGSHKLPSTVSVSVDDPNDDSDYELVGLDVDRLPGCGCWSGIVLKIRRVERTASKVER